MTTQLALPYEPAYCDLESKNMELLHSAMCWVHSLPEFLRDSALDHPRFVYPPKDFEKRIELEEDLGCLPMGDWNAILFMASEHGFFPAPQMIEVFRPLGRPGPFWLLDLFGIHSAFPGNDAIVVEGATSWIGRYDVETDDISGEPSLIREGQSMSEYFLRLTFVLAPTVARNAEAIQVVERIARREGREADFARLFSPLL